MKNIKSSILFVFIVILVTSCGTPRYLPNKYSFQNQKTINLTKTKVWDNLKVLLASLSITPNIMDVENGYIQFKNNLGTDYYDFCDCGTTHKDIGMFGRINPPFEVVTITLSAIDAKQTKITVNTSYSAVYDNVQMNFKTNQYYIQSQTNISCNSTGAMEKIILFNAEKGN